MDAGTVYDQASSVIDAVALGLIFLALLGTIAKRLEQAIWLLAGQGVLLGIAALAAAMAEDSWRPWAAFVVAFAVKAFAVPLMLYHVLQRIALRHEVETVVPFKFAF